MICTMLYGYGIPWYTSIPSYVFAYTMAYTKGGTYHSDFWGGFMHWYIPWGNLPDGPQAADLDRVRTVTLACSPEFRLEPDRAAASAATWRTPQPSTWTRSNLCQVSCANLCKFETLPLNVSVWRRSESLTSDVATMPVSVTVWSWLWVFESESPGGPPGGGTRTQSRWARRCHGDSEW
jgi:hypothetical protein